VTFVNRSAFMADRRSAMTGKLHLRFPDAASSSSIKRHVAGNERKRFSPGMFSDWLGEHAFD
jgi:hypothetical protein